MRSFGGALFYFNRITLTEGDKMTHQEIAHISNILQLSLTTIHICRKNKDAIGEDLYETLTDPLSEILEEIVELAKQPLDEI